LALSENCVALDAYSARTFDPDFRRMQFKQGTREIDRGGWGMVGYGGLMRLAFSAHSPHDDVGHDPTGRIGTAMC
jgi:hypothetical protein